MYYEDISQKQDEDNVEEGHILVPRSDEKQEDILGQESGNVVEDENNNDALGYEDGGDEAEDYDNDMSYNTNTNNGAVVEEYGTNNNDETRDSDDQAAIIVEDGDINENDNGVDAMRNMEHDTKNVDDDDIVEDEDTIAMASLDDREDTENATSVEHEEITSEGYIGSTEQAITEYVDQTISETDEEVDEGGEGRNTLDLALLKDDAAPLSPASAGLLAPPEVTVIKIVQFENEVCN